ncbi:MAG TPA: hypothetical protein VFX50_01755, partial [Gemmatimonadales bacterium]|nr:hypothetical protein [Gemmatimonadales bacterium]
MTRSDNLDELAPAAPDAVRSPTRPGHATAGAAPRTILVAEWGGDWIRGQERGPLELIAGLP